MSEVMLSNGNLDGAERCIQEAKDIWDTRSKQGTQRHGLEHFKYLWQSGVILVEVGDRDKGRATLACTLVKAERELGSNYSLVTNWKHAVEKFR